jgi:hypothetical protein
VRLIGTTPSFSWTLTRYGTSVNAQQRRLDGSYMRPSETMLAGIPIRISQLEANGFLSAHTSISYSIPKKFLLEDPNMFQEDI